MDKIIGIIMIGNLKMNMEVAITHSPSENIPKKIGEDPSLLSFLLGP